MTQANKTDSICIGKYITNTISLIENILAENRLSFWIMVSSIFGMVTSHVKCVKSVGTVPLQVNT